MQSKTKDAIFAIKEAALKQIEALSSKQEYLEKKSHIIGKKSPLMQLLSSLGSLSVEERKKTGAKANQLKQELSQALDLKIKEIESSSKASSSTRALKQVRQSISDPSMPGWGQVFGSKHPLAQERDLIIGIFKGFGFSVESGPEIETDWYNFEALNIPQNHPARDMHDTFYTTDNRVLRTHTSPVQIRAMQTQKLPLKLIVPGRVFRCDADVTHSPVFHQCEGLYIDTSVSLAQLKGVLVAFCKAYFGDDVTYRIRSSYFPFTEPSIEMDVLNKTGKKESWLEVLGAGMVHHNVLKAVKLDPNCYQGFAFGLGIDRLAMLRLKIPDIRLLYENDVRFLKQF